MPFENQSAEFGISEKVYNQLSLEFRNDGRLRVVTQQPDCLLEGSIISFEERVYSYDAANNVQDYQLRLSLQISFTDLIRNEVIYENQSLTIVEAYAVSAESTAKSKTKEEAIDELISTLFKTIIQNSLENW
ncbi:MAG: LptE family protein [Candidatus Cloacimonadaceae bacterium]|nr:LptE family protein [Candidatus Cloacimonadaceae bacterium]